MVEGTALEMRHTGNRIESSNLSVSAHINMTKTSTKNILMLLFFLTYAGLMLWEGVFKEFANVGLHWLVWFIIGAAITYWAHQKNGVITIALLFTHTTIEMIHHGQEIAVIGLLTAIVLGIHFLFDCGFLWSEMRHHVKFPKHIFIAIVLFYGIAFASSATLGNSVHGITESSETFNSAIAGGIFACVIAHALKIIKKLKNI